MHTLISRFGAGLLATLSFCAARDVESLDKGWSFFQGEADGAESADFDSSEWRKVDVPHDRSIAGEFDESAPTTGAGGWLPSGVAWYRKEFTHDAAGKRVWVEFDGVMAHSEVWLNGESLGKRPNGYVSFRYDLTPHLEENNVLVVKADTSAQPPSRWYTGAGIYRHVRLVTVDPVHVAPWGVFVSTPEAGSEKATVKVETEVANTLSESRDITLRSAVVGPDGEQLAATTSHTTIAPGMTADLSHELIISDPKLWDVEHPNLHQLVTAVMGDGVTLDEVRTPFGIRSAEFTTDEGFKLNGRSLKLKGVCLHHDGGAVGAAVPLAVWERRLEKLRELGVNAIRTAHNPVAPEFLDLCDRTGFLVMNEFFDVWLSGKKPHDYHEHFEEWAHTDMRDTIRRDRNHPCVIIYSVGNEIRDTPRPERAKPILKSLIEVCHATDPTRPVTQGLFRPNVSGDFDNGLADMLDVIGVNYRDAELLQAWEDKPGRKIVGTEQGHERSTWLECRDNPQHAGQFLWVGIDYLGEARSWPVTTFNSGLLDRAGFVQPRGLERQSWWSDAPMVRILRRVAATEATPEDPGYEEIEWKRGQVLFPDWTPESPEPHEENVEVYTNTKEVELLLNGESLGKKQVRKNFALNWKVPYEPGTLEAVAYTAGEEVARDTLRTAGEPAKLMLKADRPDLSNDWDQVAHIEVRVTDADGVVVPSAAHKIRFSIDGPTEIIAVDNGSIVSHEPFQASERSAFQGRALVILQGTGGEGKVVLKAAADGLDEAQVSFQPTE